MKRLLKALCLLLCLALPAAALGETSYLMEDSKSRDLTDAELWEWDYESLLYIYNEIFARHGYNFEKGGPFDYYFSCMPWYTPNEDSNNQRACYPKLSGVEWRNVEKIRAVRAGMRAQGTQNKGAKSVWDFFSSGFDTLSNFHYVELAREQRLPVYSAPDQSSWRGANGRAEVSTNGNVFAAGWESGWLWVMYETSNGSVRVGYVSSTDLRGNVPINDMLTFSYEPVTVLSNCTLTDDPARTGSMMTTLTAGTTVTYLTSCFNQHAWDYVETTVNGQRARGFLPAGMLAMEQMEDDAAEMPLE